MKSVMLLKIITGIMAVLIVLGITLVIHKIADSSKKIKSVAREEIILAPAEKIKEMFACGEMICVWVQGNPTEDRLIMISPKTRKIQQVMVFLGKDIN